MGQESFGLKISQVKQYQENVKCQVECPVHTDIPSFIFLAFQGKYEEAYQLITRTNPFPSITGRVCYHPCESRCSRSDIDKPLAIHALERFVGDKGVEIDDRRREKPKTRPEKVAIIGGGPSGLTAAYYLAKLGHLVTIFEALPQAGGMLRVGIPEYRLPKEILKKEVEKVEGLGVEIRTNTKICKDTAFNELEAQGFKAILIAVGAPRSLQLNIPGEDLNGVYHGIDFLRKISLGERIEIGKKIAIIGGGNTAIDAARTALRLGAKEIFLIYRRSREEMPANKLEVKALEEEEVKIYYLTSPVRILGNKGWVSGLECVRMQLGEPDASGRRRPIPLEGSEFVVEADTVIPAISQVPDISFLPKDHGLEVSSWGSLVVDEETLVTDKPHIFAAGDIVTGPQTVTLAIGAGHKAAISIDRYLEGERFSKIGKIIKLEAVDSAERDLRYDSIKRQKILMLPMEKRILSFEEVELEFREEMVQEEAKRCLRCDLNVYIDEKECLACGRCYEVCPYRCFQMVKPNGEINYHYRPFPEGKAILKADMFCIRCGLCKNSCPVKAIGFRRCSLAYQAI